MLNLWSSLGDWSFGGSSLVVLGLSSFLLLHLLHVSGLELLLGGVESLVSSGFVLSSLSLDLIEGHTNDGLLDSGGLSSSLLLDVLDLDLLVISSRGLGPGELNWLDFLVEQSSGLRGDEKVHLSILTSESGASTRVDFDFGKCARISLDNH